MDLNPSYANSKHVRVKKQADRLLGKFKLNIGKKVDKEDNKIFTDFMNKGGSLDYEKLSTLKDSKKEIYYNAIWGRASNIASI